MAFLTMNNKTQKKEKQRKTRVYPPRPIEIQQRIDYILNSISEGRLQIDIARDLNITRERVRQIYNKNATIPYRDIRYQILQKLKVEKLDKLGREVNYICKACDRPVYKIENGKKTMSGSLLCHICHDKYLAPIKRTCDWCGIEYAPYRSILKLGLLTNYCKREHYFKFLSAFKKSVYHERLRKQTKLIRSLEEKIERFKKNKTAHPVSLSVSCPVSWIPQRKDTCKKCTIMISGEFEKHKSKFKPDLCSGCDGSKFEIETSPFKSGLVSGVAFGRQT